MRSEAEEEATSPRSSSLTLLPIIPSIPMASSSSSSPERSGIENPPLQTTASVPFRWEEEPGKPKNPIITTLTHHKDFTQKCLELPPRMMMLNKLPSPNTLLDCPYQTNAKLKPDSSSSSSSFRMAKDCYGGRSSSPEGNYQVGALVLSKRWQKEKGKGFLFGGWVKKISFKGKGEINGGSYVFPSLIDKDSEGSNRNGEEEIGGKIHVKMTRVKRSGSLPILSQAKSHFWTSICENLKQVVPWKKRKTKREELII